MADIIKLKALLESGVLSQAQYDAAIAVPVEAKVVLDNGKSAGERADFERLGAGKVLDKINKSSKWEVAPGKFPLFRGDGPTVHDCVQGQLGDSVLVSTMASIAHAAPSIIKNMFADKKDADSPSEVTLSTGVVTVPNTFVVAEKTKAPKFAKQRDCSWLAVLENALGQVHGFTDFPSLETSWSGGSWQRIIMNLCFGKDKNFVTHRMMLAPSRESSRAAWSAIREMYPGGTLAAVTAGSKRTPKAGIVAGHSYSVLTTADVMFKGEQIRLVQLRNAWGKFEWAGKFSEKDPIWKEIEEEAKKDANFEKVCADFGGPVPEALKNTPHTDTLVTLYCKFKQFGVEDDGVFWMPWSTFMRSFQNISITPLCSEGCASFEGKFTAEGNGSVSHPQFILEGKEGDLVVMNLTVGSPNGVRVAPYMEIYDADSKLEKRDGGKIVAEDTIAYHTVSSLGFKLPRDGKFVLLTIIYDKDQAYPFELRTSSVASKGSKGVTVVQA